MVSFDSIYDLLDEGWTAAEIKAKVDEIDKELQEQSDKEEEIASAREALASAFADYLCTLDVIQDDNWEDVSTEVFTQFEEFEQNIIALKKLTNKSKTEKKEVAEKNYEKELRALVEDLLSL